MKMRSWGWTLTHYDRYPYKRGKFGHRDTQTQGDDYVKICRESSMQMKDWGDISTEQGMLVAPSSWETSMGQTLP